MTLGPHPASGGASATFPRRGRHPAPSLPPRGKVAEAPQRRMRADLPATTHITIHHPERSTYL